MEPPEGAEQTPEAWAPTYDHAPPTIEVPFEQFASQTPAGGRPLPGFGGPPIAPPVIVGLPLIDESAGATRPDGYAVPHSFEPPTDPGRSMPGLDASTDPNVSAGAWIDPGPTHAAARPLVPAPDAPNIEVSMSLQIEAAVRESSVPVAPPPRVIKRVPQGGPGPHAETQVLPAIKKTPKKEGSDWPLALGLVGLGLLILLLVGGIAYGVFRLVRAPEAQSSSQR